MSQRSKSARQSDAVDAATQNSFTRELGKLRNDFNAQLDRLRAEHAALCVCLGNAGVLSATSLNQEIARTSTSVRGIPKGDIKPVEDSAKKSWHTTSSSKPEQKATVSTSKTPMVAGAGGSVSVPKGVERPPSAASHQGGLVRSSSAPIQKPTASRRDHRSNIEKLLQGEQSHPHLVATKSAPSAGKKEPSKSSRSSDDPIMDLYDLAFPLLHSSCAPALKSKALKDVKEAILGGKRPDVWRGPETPLLAAHQAGCSELVQLLLKSRANPNVPNEKGAGPLHRAAFDGDIDAVISFIKARADPNLGDQHNQTPLFFAPTSHVCDVLCQRNADTNVVNTKGQSALHLAAMANLGDVLLWLSQNVSRQLLDMKDTEGFSAEVYARRKGMKPEVLRKIRPWDPTRSSREEVFSRSVHAASFKQRAKKPGEAPKSVSLVCSLSDSLPSPSASSEATVLRDTADSMILAEEQAALRIQAVVRGKQGRREASDRTAEREEAANPDSPMGNSNTVLSSESSGSDGPWDETVTESNLEGECESSVIDSEKPGMFRRTMQMAFLRSWKVQSMRKIQERGESYAEDGSHRLEARKQELRDLEGIRDRADAKAQTR